MSFCDGFLKRHEVLNNPFGILYTSAQGQTNLPGFYNFLQHSLIKISLAWQSHSTYNFRTFSKQFVHRHRPAKCNHYNILMFRNLLKRVTQSISNDIQLILIHCLINHKNNRLRFPRSSCNFRADILENIRIPFS
eukprot:EC095946.1.p2 GENE.EC095946.1~~EC095946.1.p2  ORF type:complete len:135 (-),score=6.83 EC095946.1:12-416(-)